MLLASSLGAMLLIAAAHSAGVYADNLAALTADDGRAINGAITSFARDLRYAWWAEVTASSTVLIAGPDGAESTWHLGNQQLTVTRGNGGTDVVVSGLRAGSFKPSILTRWRELPPVTTTSSYWSMDAGPALPMPLALDGVQRLAVAFMLHSDAAVSGRVAGVTEQLVSASLDTWTLPVATALNHGGLLVIELYRARAPDDGRPYGGVLARTEISLLALPAATLLPAAVVPIVRGATPMIEQVTAADLIDRLVAPSRSTALDISGLGASVEPGRAYVLVIGVKGSGLVVVKSHTLVRLGGTGCATSATAADAFARASITVPCSLSGSITHTATSAINVLGSVAISLTDSSGVTSQGSFSVQGQTLIKDPWLGAVPTETPDLTRGTP